MEEEVEQHLFPFARFLLACVIEGRDHSMARGVEG